MKKLLLSAAPKAIAVSLMICAAPVVSSTTDTRHQNTQYSDSSEDSLHHGLTEDDRSQARQWQLTDTEWTRYKDIMSGRRGIWSPGLDPVTALGVHAETEQERTRYAELWIKLEYERTEKELAFERARMAAAKRLYPDMPAIRNEAFVERFQARRAANSRSSHMILFTGLECSSCDSIISRLRGGLGSGSRLDIYINNASDDQIREWAAQHDIPPELVQQGVITLNRARYSDMITLGVFGSDPKLFSLDEDGNAQPISL